MKHIHWTFQAYNKADILEEDKIRHVVEVTTVGQESEEDALLSAQMMVKRDVVALRRSWQCSQCEAQEEHTNLMRELLNKHKD